MINFEIIRGRFYKIKYYVNIKSKENVRTNENFVTRVG